MISITFIDTFNSHYHGTFFDSLQKADFVKSLGFLGHNLCGLIKISKLQP